MARKQPEPEANLGCATTREMLVELESRFAITTIDNRAKATVRGLLEYLSAEVLNYRTVDGEKRAPVGDNLKVELGDE